MAVSNENGRPKSYFMVTFEDVGSVVFSVTTGGCTPLQLIALAGYLEVYGKNALIRQENEAREKEEARKLAVPTPEILVANR